MFGPVITAEAHLAFSDARTHSNNTAEITAMVEALSVLGPRGPVAVMRVRVFIMTPNMLLVCVWAGSSPHTCAAGASMSTIYDQCPNTGYGSPCNTYLVTVDISVMNVLIMPPHLGHSALPLTITLPPAGFIITLMHPRVLMVVTTSERSWNECNTLEQMQRHFPKIGVSIVCTIGFIVFVVLLT